MWIYAWQNNYSVDFITSVTWFEYNLQTRYKIQTRCYNSSSTGARTFRLCQMYMHNKRIAQMISSTWPCDLGTIYRHDKK